MFEQGLVREGVRMLFERHADLVVVGEAATPAEALALAERERPSVIVLGFAVSHGTRADVISRLTAGPHGRRVLLLTDAPDADQHREAILSGASGVVPQQQGGDVLLKAVRCVHAGEVWADRGTTARVLLELRNGATRPAPDSDAGRIAALTHREREIVALVSQGLNTRKIADQLSISEKTVRNHLASIYAKLGVSERLELALYAVKHRLVAENAARAAC